MLNLLAFGGFAQHLCEIPKQVRNDTMTKLLGSLFFVYRRLCLAKHDAAHFSQILIALALHEC